MINMDYAMKVAKMAEDKLSDLYPNVRITPMECVKNHRKNIGFTFNNLDTVSDISISPITYIPDEGNDIERDSDLLYECYCDTQAGSDEEVNVLTNIINNKLNREYILKNSVRVLMDPKVSDDSDKLIGREYHGLKIIYRMLFDDTRSALLTEDMCKFCRITEEELYTATEIFEYRFANIFEMMGTPDDASIEDCSMFVLTNNSRVYGASVITSRSILDAIIERLNTPVYLLPSSIHEWIVVKDDGHMDAKDLLDIVSMVNCAVLEAKDFLSDSVYHLDMDCELKRVA